MRERRAFVSRWMPYAVACCTLHQLHVVVACCMRHAVVVARRALSAAWCLSHSGLGLLHCRAVHRIALLCPTQRRWVTGGVPILRDAVLARHIADLHRRPGLAPKAPQWKCRRRRQHPQQMLTSAAAAAAECTQTRAHGCAALRCCCGGDEHCVSTDRSGRPALPIMQYYAVLAGTDRHYAVLLSAAAPAATSCAPRPTTPSGAQTCT